MPSNAETATPRKPSENFEIHPGAAIPITLAIMKNFIPILVLLFNPLVNAEDIRGKVRVESENESFSIDPGKHAYGVPWGATEDEFINIEGQPNGYLKLTKSKTAMLYGRSHAFIFVEGKLEEIRITSQIIDWKLANQVSDNFKRRDSNWKLANGVHAEMNEKRLKELLGDKLRSTDHASYFEENGCRVELNFVSYSMGERKGQRTVHGVYIVSNRG